MSWKDIKETPRHELDGLLQAFSIHATIHAFDGHTPKDIGRMSKDNPHVGRDYRRSEELKDKYTRLGGLKTKPKVQSFSEIIK